MARLNTQCYTMRLLSRPLSAALLSPRSFKHAIHSNSRSLSVYAEKSPITVELWKKREEVKARAARPPSSEPAKLKKPSESRVDVRYDFGCTADMRDLYVDAFGNMLMGKLLEDLDALAGNVAFFHADDGKSQEESSLSLVTAGVEKIKFERKGVPLDNDVLVTGQVVYTGSSSLDVLVEGHIARSDNNNDDQTISILDPAEDETRVFSSIFTYVARDKKSGKAAKVAGLDLTGEDVTEHEKACFAQREAAAALRKAIRKGEAGPEEQPVLGQKLRWEMLERGKSMLNMPALHAHQDFVLQETTALENSFICEPQKSNTGGRVFGGFLINKAYMLAQANAYLFSGLHSTLTMVDKITFRRPVEISDLIRLRSRCTYSSDEMPRRMVVQVTVDVVHPERGESFQSNKFTFVFTCSDDGRNSDSGSGTVNRKMIVPLNRLEADFLFYGAVNVLEIPATRIEAEYSPRR